MRGGYSLPTLQQTNWYGTVPNMAKTQPNPAFAVLPEMSSKDENGSNAKRIRTSRGLARLEALIATAGEMFLEQGYAAVSLDAIVLRAGGSRRNIYEEFGDKEGLFVQAVTRLCLDELKPIAALQIPLDEDERTALTFFGERLLEVVLLPRTLALHRLMIGEGSRFPMIGRAMFKAGDEACAEILAVWIAARQSQGWLRTDIAAYELAEEFVALLVRGPQLRALTGMALEASTASDISRLTARAVELFIAGAMTKGD